MTTVTLIHVGDFRESYFREAETEYCKRLRRFCDYRTVLIPEYRISDEESLPLVKRALEKEAEKIRAAIPPRSTVVALCVEGKQLSSESFASLLEEKTQNGPVCFLIGSSHGLDETLKRECQVRLSLSAMTFPHRFARLLLAEQLYRGFSILAGNTYHK